MKKIIVAIDGHSSCGKSTMAKALARQLGYIYVDTGAMYRAVTLFAPQVQVSFVLNEDTHLPVTHLNGVSVEREIRTMEVSSHVSPIAALPFVREAMVAQQREMGKQKGIVMDGRDIGTTVFPHAELKVFVTASAEIRAQRRFKELQEKGMDANYEAILKNVQERDYIDSHREVSPLCQAEDAILLDNSNMSISNQQQWLLEQVQRICH